MRNRARVHALPTLLALATALALAFGAAGAGAQASGTLRVGTSGDYAPFSVAAEDEAGGFEGFDIAVARAYAEERGLAIEFVRFRWPQLISGLARGRFDVAMSGVTVRPERSAVGRFTVPVVETGAVLIVRQPERWSRLDDLDRRDIRIGVNAGGHLERVARGQFPQATLVAIRDNRAVRHALIEANIHAAVSDSLEAPIWLRGAEGLAVFGPFTRDRKAYLVSEDRPGLAADLDAWLLARERDGALARLRREYLGAAAAPAMATPLASLLAAIDERLALMPMIGAAKRRSGLPLEVPEREAVVLDAAVAGARAAATRAGAASPPASAVRALFRAQMEAAKEVQWNAVRDPAFSPPEPLPDLNASLRPALLRIGERIARLLLALPEGLDPAPVREAAREALRTPRLSERSTLAIADAITALSRAPRGEQPPPPAPQ
jgi:cyclohexadienyl dehydratase